MQQRFTHVQRNDNGKKCSYCDRIFTKEEHLKRHERTHTGERPFKCQKCYRSYGRSDVLARHLQTHHVGNPNRQGSVIQESVRARESSITPNTSAQNGPAHLNSNGDANLNAISQSLSNGDPLVLAPLHHEQVVASLNDPSERHTISSSTWNDNSQIDANDTIQQGVPVSTSVAGISSGVVTNIGNAVLEGETGTTADGQFTNNTDQSILSFQHMTHNEENFASLMRQRSIHHQTIIQETSFLPDSHAFETDPFQFEADLDTYGYFTPNMMEGLDFASPRTPIAFDKAESGQNQSFLSNEQTRKIRRLWRGRRSAPSVRLIWSFWFKVAHHEADNICSMPTTTIASPNRLEQPVDGFAASRWGVDEECRMGLIKYSKELDERISSHESAEGLPNSPPQTRSESGSEKSLPGFSADGFPTREVLDASMDFFFQYFPMPFIHKATFDAKKTPASLLFPMCLVGLASLYPERSKSFVLHYQKKLMQSCRDDLTSKALGHGDSWELLISIASAFLIVYLALGDLFEVEECQAHMLCLQMLHIVQKHGLFSAYLGDDLAVQLQVAPQNHESSWKIWARIESMKRLICYLLWVDAACTRVMGTAAGVLDMDKVELHIPCDALLFEVTTFPRFLQAVNRGIPLVTSRLRIHDFKSSAPSTLDSSSMITLLSSLHLQAAAARHELLGGNNTLLESSSCTPAQVFAMNAKSEKIVSCVIMLPSKYANLFQRMEPLAMLAWNNLCLSLTADLDLLEVLSGREGPDSARIAVTAVTKWSRSPSARRSVLHASQIFHILSSSRLRESNISRADRLLFVSALVLSIYLFVVGRKDEDQNLLVLELLQDVDWTAVGSEGLQFPPGENETATPGSISQVLDPVNAAKDFIRKGGPVSFAGEDQLGGATTSRKILLNYVHLLDDVGKWRESRYSQLLRIMSDLMVESV